VVHLAETLEIPRDVALRAMADHVVPDLGVLKEYGPVDYDGRIASFVNGMSANERAGFLSNWQRMGFGAFSERSGLEEQHVVVVNNRADRLARQQVVLFDSPQEIIAPLRSGWCKITDATGVIGSSTFSGSQTVGLSDWLPDSSKCWSK